MKALIYLLELIVCLLFFGSCSNSQISEKLDRAETLVTSNADSTLLLLNSIPQSDLSGEQAARWGLFYTWALYRNYAKEIPEEYLLAAFDFYATSSNPLRRAQVFYLHSVVHEDQHRGTPREWLEDMYNACLAIEQTQDHVLAAQIYQRYEHKLYTMHQYEESIEWSQRFCDEAQKSGNVREEILALTHLSLSYLMTEDARVKKELGTTDGDVVAQYANFRDAFMTIYRALELAEQHHLEPQVAKVCGNLSSYYSRTQQLDSALCYALRAKTIDERLLAEGRIKGPINYLHVADIYRKVGEADSALYYAQQTLRYPGITTRRNAAQLMYITYRDLKNDYRQALDWMETYCQIQDSIYKRIEEVQVGAAQDAVDKDKEKVLLLAESRHAREWLVAVILIAAILIILVLVRMVNNRLAFRELTVRQEAEINKMIEEMQKATQIVTPPQPSRGREETDTPVVDHPEPNDDSINTPSLERAGEESRAGEGASSLLLTGNTREQLEIQPESVLFLTSESNYIKVYYINEEAKMQSKMLRQTMSRVEEMLASCPYIVRCHRAFFVNLHHVIHASSVPTGLSLTLDQTTISVPVSRTYISTIKEHLAH